MCEMYKSGLYYILGGNYVEKSGFSYHLSLSMAGSARANNLALIHVEALNMIDVSFYGADKKNKKVISSWKVYLDHLNNQKYPKDVWEPKRKELFVELLHTMAVALDYNFDKSHISNTSYYPAGHGEIEGDQIQLRKGLVALLKGKIPLPMHLTRPIEPIEQDSHNKEN